MNNKQISLFALAAIAAVVSVSFLRKSEREDRKSGKLPKKRSDYYAVAHDIGEALVEEMDGLKNRLFSGACKDRRYFSSRHKAAV